MLTTITIFHFIS